MSDLTPYFVGRCAAFEAFAARLAGDGSKVVNGITVRDVNAAVIPDEQLKTNLLGMSFLSRVKWSYDRGRLMLEQ